MYSVRFASFIFASILLVPVIAFGQAAKKPTIGSVVNANTAYNNAVTFPTNKSLSTGSRSSAVTYLKAQLALLGYYTDAITPQFDTKTKAAISKFQRDNRIMKQPTGVADYATQQMLFETTLIEAKKPVSVTASRLNQIKQSIKKNQKKKSRTSTTASSTAKTPNSGPAPKVVVNLPQLIDVELKKYRNSLPGKPEYFEIKPGVSHPLIMHLKQAMAQAGHYTGVVNQLHSPDFAATLKTFQEARELDPSGNIDIATIGVISALVQ